MNKNEKYKVIQKLKCCKTFDQFKGIYSELDFTEKIYAQCFWLCKKYQFDRESDKINRLEHVVDKYSLDLDKIKEFEKTNLKHNETDKHLSNIINLDKRLHDEEFEKNRLSFIGDEIINIVSIEKPMDYYDFNKEKERFFEAYKYNYEKSHLNKSPLTRKAFGRYLKVKKVENLGYRTNSIILSKNVVEGRLFDFIHQMSFSYKISSKVKITRDLDEFYSKEILDNLDKDGIIKVGSNIKQGDVLIGCVKFKERSKMTPEEYVMAAIFGYEGRKQDASFKFKNSKGVVSKVEISKIKTYQQIDIDIDQTFSLEIGDILGDINLNKGKIVEIISEKEMINRFGDRYDLISNFDIDKYVIRYRPVVKEELNYSIGENHTLLYQSPTDYNDVLKPILIDKKIFNKFHRYGLINNLSNAIKYSKWSYKDPRNQIILDGCFRFQHDVTSFNCIKNWLLALGFELKLKEKNNKYEIELIKLTDEEKKEISSGEILRAETFNYRTLKPEKDGLLCEKIFGPTKNYNCACGKYAGIKFKDGVCENCGVKVETNEGRYFKFGHINLNEEVDSVSGRKTKTILVIPPEQRYCFIKEGAVVSAEENDLYRRILYRSDRLKKIRELDVPEVIKEDEFRMLSESVIEYEKFVLGRIRDYIKFLANKSRVTFSFKGICGLNNSLANDKCLIPKECLFKLFEPYIIHKLIKEGTPLEQETEDEDIFADFDENSLFDDFDIENNNENKIEKKDHIEKKDDFKVVEKKGMSYKEAKVKFDSRDVETLEIFKNLIKEKKFIFFSPNSEGDLLYLNIEATDGNSIILNEENYMRLCSTDGIVEGLMPLIDEKEYENKILNYSKTFDDIDNIEDVNDLFKTVILEEDLLKASYYILKEILKGKIEVSSEIGKYIIKSTLI